jgi:hypothetical protein
MTSRIACLDATLVAAEDRGLRHSAPDKAESDSLVRAPKLKSFIGVCDVAAV